MAEACRAQPGTRSRVPAVRASAFGQFAPAVRPARVILTARPAPSARRAENRAVPAARAQ
jgi:hypothetical protein